MTCVSVQACCGRNEWRKVQSQIRIDNGRLGEKSRAAQTGFDAVGGRSQDGIARDLRPSTGCGGHGYEWQRRMFKRATLANDFEVV